MTHESPGPTERPEQDKPALTPYEIGVRHMLGALAAAPDPAETANRPDQLYYYYKDLWTDEVPARLAALSVYAAGPTGARRSERWGVFHAAQFRVQQREVVSGASDERFLWIDTGAQYEGEALVPDALSLRRRHGYKPLNPTTVVADLSEQAASPDDYLALLEALAEHDTPPVQEVATALNRFTFDLVRQGIASGANEQVLQQEREKVFALIEAWGKTGGSVLRMPHNYLLTNLLQTIYEARVAGSRDVSPRAGDHAAQVLRLALEKGVIPEKPAIYQRVLPAPFIYRYRFATDMLHEHIHDPEVPANKSQLFRQNRNAFARNFLIGVMQSGEKPLDPRMASFLEASAKSIKTAQGRLSDAGHLYQFVNGARAVLHNISEATEADSLSNPYDYIQVQNAEDVIAASVSMLQTLNGAADQEFIDKCSAVLTEILTPDLEALAQQRAPIDVVDGVDDILDGPSVIFDDNGNIHIYGGTVVIGNFPQAPEADADPDDPIDTKT